MIREKEYLKALNIVKAYQRQINEQVQSVVIQDLPDNLEDMDLTVPAFNAIKSILRGCGIPADVTLKEQLSYVTLHNLKATRGAGPKVTEQIKKVLGRYGIDLK